MVDAGKVETALDEALFVRAEAAAERWEARASVRQARRKAIEAGKYLSAEPRSRLALRVNRLMSAVRRASQTRRPPADPKLRALAERPVMTDNELTDDLVKEAVLGARNFLSIEFFERGLLTARSVGRIVMRAGGGIRARGTGFLVAPGLLLTNEHVLTDDGIAALCAVEMDYEQNLSGPLKRVQQFSLKPDIFFLNDHDLDFALVGVAPQSDGGRAIESYGWLPLDPALGKISVLPEDLLNIIQHPLGREKEIVIRDNHVLDLRTEAQTSKDVLGNFLHYEGDTEKGSSGSPVLNDQWEVVALHHSGVPRRDGQGRFLDKQGKSWDRTTQPIEAIDWIANEGVRVSSLVHAIERAQVRPHERPLQQSLLAKQAPRDLGIEMADDDRAAPARERGGPAGGQEEDRRDRREAKPSTASGAKARTATARSGETVEISVPIVIGVRLGRPGAVDFQGTVTAAALKPARVDEEILIERLDPEDYADRKGFNETFLDVKIPLPTIKANRRFGDPLVIRRPSHPDGDKFELKYHHFSVVMNERRRLAYFSAANIDFDAPVNLSRKEGTNTWRIDPRIDDDDQADNIYYADNEYDRGHLTRRDDAAWGKTKAEARAANNDTFHWTNAAPQHQDFNQSDEFTHKNLKLWGDLENHISTQGAAQRTRLCVINGPIFGANDKPLKDIRVPFAFFKIVVFKDKGDQLPGAVGFVLEQNDLIEDLPEEAIEAGVFAVRQRRIDAIQQMVDIDFGPVVGWDRLAARGGQPGQEALEDDRPLLKLADIVL